MNDNFRKMVITINCTITKEECEKKISCTECKISERFNLTNTMEMFNINVSVNKGKTFGKIDADHLNTFVTKWGLKEHNTSDILNIIETYYPFWQEYRELCCLIGSFSHYYRDGFPLLVCHNHKDVYIITPKEDP